MLGGESVSDFYAAFESFMVPVEGSVASEADMVAILQSDEEALASSLVRADFDSLGFDKGNRGPGECGAVASFFSEFQKNM